jgi:uncharacterized protein YlxP (DUF503 family)
VHVAICRLTLHINSSHSLKDKRRVVHSLRSRLSSKFGIAVAEVDDQDAWQVATLGLAAVSQQRAHVESVMDKALEYVYVVAPEAEVSSSDTDIFSY